MKTNIDTIREALNSEFKDSQWVAYEASDCDTETFETYDQAKAWLDGFNDDGISEETEQGYSYIARITHRTAMEITDRKENYHQHTDSCGALTDECDEETWPYDDEYDHVGSVYMVALSTIDQDAGRIDPIYDPAIASVRNKQIASLRSDIEDYQETSPGVWQTPSMAYAESAWKDMIAAGEHGPKAQHLMIKTLAEHFKSHDDAIRRECADRAVNLLRLIRLSDEWGDLTNKRMISAILGKEAEK